MALTVRFTGPATNNTTITISWLGGYPPSGTASATETFKVLRSTPWQTTIGSTAHMQAVNFYNALSIDYATNFTLAQVNNDVIISPKNGTTIISGTTSSPNILFNPISSQMYIIGSPQQFVPVYNPITYRFFSSNYSLPGYRYLVNVYNTITGDELARFKVSPQIDATGYIDISKVLSNFTSVDFDPSLNIIDNCSNSYIAATIKIGEEYQSNWQFNQIITATGTNAGYMQLIQSPTSSAHTYMVGDQLNIDTTLASTNGDIAVNGLHTVLQVINGYKIVIDAVKSLVGTTSTVGIISYADGRKTSYNNLLQSYTIGFNGVRNWLQFPEWDWMHWYIQYGLYQSPDCELLTSLRINAETLNQDDRFYMTPSQSIWLNMAVDEPNNEWIIDWSAGSEDGAWTYESGQFTITNNSGNNGNVKQFKICPDELIGTSSYYEQIDKITFRVFDDQVEPVTRYYGIYLDKRCKIEQYELYFMDRMGSILSFACQLRAKQTGTITRESGKQQVYYNETDTSYSNVYDTWDRGSNINYVTVSEDLELNTNWMNNEMSLLFDELLTSPYVWLKIVTPATNEQPEKINFTSVIVNENSFEVQKQKNKRLIRKTITVKMANENIINI